VQTDEGGEPTSGPSTRLAPAVVADQRVLWLAALHVGDDRRRGLCDVLWHAPGGSSLSRSRKITDFRRVTAKW